MARLTPGRVHALCLVVAAIFLVREAHRLWWGGDDWDFLLHRGVLHPDRGLFEPHNEHWSTVPILAYRLTYTLVGLHHYLPYALWVLAAHLITSHLLWRLLLRTGVPAWTATALTAGFVLAGAGTDDVLWDFQLGFTASVMFGIWALYIAEGADPHGRLPSRSRLACVWVLLVLSLMCSGIGVTMTVLVGLVTAWRRQWWRAAALVSLPGVVFAVWYETYGHDGVDVNTFGVTSANARNVPDFVWTGLEHALENFLGIPGAGPLLLVGLAVLLGRALSAEDARGARWTGLAGGSAVAVVVFFTITSLGRVGLGASESTASRYGYIAIAIALPAIALVLPPRTWVAGLLGIVLVVGATVGTLGYVANRRTTLAPERQGILAAAQLLTAGETFVAGAVYPQSAPDVTTAALAAVVRRGEMSPGAPLPAAVLAAARATLEIGVAPDTATSLPPLRPAGANIPAPDATGCITVSHAQATSMEFITGQAGGTATLLTAAGTSLPVSLQTRHGPIAASAPVALTAGGTVRLVVSARDAVVRLALPPTPVQVCGLAR